MRLTGWFVRVAGLVLLCLSLSCGNDVGPRVPANIVIVPNQPVVPQGLTLALTATVVDAAGRAIGGKVITFTSLDTLTATVSASGVVTSRGPLGTARIRAESGGLSAQVIVGIGQRIVSIAVSPDTLRLNTGGSGFLTPTGLDAAGALALVPSDFTFTSSDTTRVVVATPGYVASVGSAGTATITVAFDTFSVNVPVIIAQIPTAIAVSPAAVVILPGASQQLGVTLRDALGMPIPGATFQFSGDAPALFSVSSTGLVTSLGPTGAGTITVVLPGDTLVAQVPVRIGNGPFGVLAQRTSVAGPGYASAVSAAGAMIVSLPTTTNGLRGDLPAYTLSAVAGLSDPLGVAINPAGTLGYFALRSGGVAVLDLATNTLQAPLTGISGAALSVAVSADGQSLFAGGDTEIYKFDAATGTLLDSAAINSVVHLAVHPTQALLYASSASGLVAEINTATMAQVRSFSGITFPQAVAVAPDGSELYVADEGGLQVKAFNLATGLAATSFVTAAGSFGLAATGSLLVATESSSGQVELFDRVSRVRFALMSTGGTPRRPAVNAAGDVIVVPNEGGWVDFIR